MVEKATSELMFQAKYNWTAGLIAKYIKILSLNYRYAWLYGSFIYATHLWTCQSR